jgi:hypothetical protein
MSKSKQRRTSPTIQAIDNAIDWLPRIHLAKIVADYAKEFPQELAFPCEQPLLHGDSHVYFKYPLQLSHKDFTIRTYNSTVSCDLGISFPGRYCRGWPPADKKTPLTYQMCYGRIYQLEEGKREYHNIMITPSAKYCLGRKKEKCATAQNGHACHYHDAYFNVTYDVLHDYNDENIQVAWSLVTITYSNSHWVDRMFVQTRHLLHDKISLRICHDERAYLQNCVCIIKPDI